MVKLQPNYENRISANEICQQLSRNENPDNVLDFLFLVSYNCGQIWSKKCFLGGHLPQGSVRFWCFVKEGLYQSYILRRGVYYGKLKEYYLNFVFRATSEKSKNLLVCFVRLSMSLFISKSMKIFLCFSSPMHLQFCFLTFVLL